MKKPKPNNDLNRSLLALVDEMRELVVEMKAEREWRGSHAGLATKQDLKEMEKRIMKTLADLDAEIKGDLTDAATAIEAALADALSKITVPADAQPQFDEIAAIAAALKASVTPAAPPLSTALKAIAKKRK